MQGSDLYILHVHQGDVRAGEAGRMEADGMEEVNRGGGGEPGTLAAVL